VIYVHRTWLLVGQLLVSEQETTSQAMQIKALQGNSVF